MPNELPKAGFCNNCPARSCFFTNLDTRSVTDAKKAMLNSRWLNQRMDIQKKTRKEITDWLENYFASEGDGFCWIVPLNEWPEARASQEDALKKQREGRQQQRSAEAGPSSSASSSSNSNERERGQAEEQEQNPTARNSDEQQTRETPVLDLTVASSSSGSSSTSEGSQAGLSPSANSRVQSKTADGASSSSQSAPAVGTKSMPSAASASSTSIDTNSASPAVAGPSDNSERPSKRSRTSDVNRTEDCMNSSITNWILNLPGKPIEKEEEAYRMAATFDEVGVDSVAKLRFIAHSAGAMKGIMEIVNKDLSIYQRFVLKEALNAL